MAKETQKDKIVRLEAENERLLKNFNDCLAENQQLQKKLNAKIEDTDEYKRCAQQLQKMEQQRGTAIGQRDHYHAKVQQLEAERDTLRKQLTELQATYEAQSAAESVPESIPLEEWQQDIIGKLKEIYENQNQNLNYGTATKILRIWSTTPQAEEALKLLYDYFLAPLPYEDEQDITSAEVFAQLEAQEDTIKGLKAQISDTKNAEQYNNAMGNYEMISKQAKKIKELEKQLDASATAQNALKSDLESVQAELQALKQPRAKRTPLEQEESRSLQQIKYKKFNGYGQKG